MATGSIVTKVAFNAILDKMFNSSSTVSIISKFGIGSGGNTPALTDTALQTPITAWSGGSSYKAYVGGYPTFDTTNQLVTVQGFISSAEANGQTILEYGDFNTDGTPKLFGRFVFVSSISKTSAFNIYVTTVYQRMT